MAELRALALLTMTAVTLGARPSFIDGPSATTCLSCHSTAGATLSFISVNGGPAPLTATVVQGGALGVVWRVQGLSSSMPIGAQVRPVGGKAGWDVSTGPLWTDNARSGATAWATGSSVAWRSALAGAQGQTPNNGGGSDLNALSDNEVFSVSLTAASLSPGFYDVELGAGADNGGQRFAALTLKVQVLAPSPSPTPTPSPTANLSNSPTPSPSETPVLSATPSATITPTASISPTFTPATQAQSFAGVQDLRLLASPVRGTLRLWAHLQGAAEESELRLYSAAGTLLLAQSLGPAAGSPRWNVPVPGLAAQPVWIQLRVRQDGRWRTGPTLRSYLLP